MKSLTAIVLVALVLATTIGYAIWLSKQVQHSGIVIVERQFKLYKDFGDTTELTAIDWTNLLNHTGQSLNVTAFIRNLNSHVVYVNWNTSAMPTGIQLKMYFSGSDLNPPPAWTFNPWTYDTLRTTLPVGVLRTIRFELTITASANEGVFSYTQYFTGFDTET